MSQSFPYETLAAGPSFVGRSGEIAKIEQMVASSANLLLYSKRRIGKTSLIKEAFRRLEGKCLCIYAEVFDITSAEEFAAHLLKALANSQTGDIKTVLKQLASLFKRTRVEPTVDPTTLKYSIKPVVRSLTFEEMMEDFFESIFELSKSTKVVVAIDEFQQIALVKNVKIDAVLRKYMQEEHPISYIFLGSKRHTLNELFEYKSPLFEMATPMELGPLDAQEIHAYASQYLNISLEMVHRIHAMCEGETKLMQHVLHIIHRDHTTEAVNDETLREALQEIISAKSTSYRIVYDALSLNQKKALKILSKERGKNMFAAETLYAYRTKKENVSAALRQLFTRELVDRDEDRWFIPDRAFELWCVSLS